MESGNGGGADPVQLDEPESTVQATSCPDVGLDLRTTDVQPPLEGWLDRQVARIARHAGVGSGQLNLVVVNRPFMIELNQRFKGQGDCTDVLTFDLSDQDDQAASIEADVVICIEEAVEQAIERGHDIRVEVLLYAVHGLMHLIGLDDRNPELAQRMHDREDELLSEAGFGSVFSSN